MASPHSVYQQHANQIAKGAGRLGRYGITLSEAVFDLSFVVNFILGKLLHVFAQEEEVYNYYNNKGNVINQWFVKKGWAWTTLAVVVLYAFLVPARPRQQRAGMVAMALFRYIAATVWWVLFTQWCFGLPIMDRVFLLTGGRCALISAPRVAALHGADGALSRHFYVKGGSYESVSVSSHRCRQLRGSWEGGHDPLGHVFLLVHASLYMFHEMKASWPGWLRVLASAGELCKRLDVAIGERLGRFLRSAPHAPAVLLLALWWFMLLVTNMYFHSLSEKLVGLVFGYLGVLVVYYGPRYVRRARLAAAGV